MNTLADMAEYCRTSKKSLPDALIQTIVDELLQPDVSDDSKAEFLRAQSERGETADEVAAFANALQIHSVDAGLDRTFEGKRLLDCCGPGGGGLSILNVSTAAVFVLAAAGVPVAKHGNRGVTKKSGSADVLEALGLCIELSPAQARNCLGEVGATFYFARTYHPAFKHVAGVRQMLGAEGRKTIFNLLGPVLNPANPATQLIGVFDPKHVALYDEILRDLHADGHAVVRGLDEASGRAIGEVSTLGENEKRGRPAGGDDLGEWELERSAGSLESLEIADATQSAHRLEAVLRGEETGLARDLVVANAAAGILVQGSAATFEEAHARASEALACGEAHRRLEAWRSFSAKL